MWDKTYEESCIPFITLIRFTLLCLGCPIVWKLHPADRRHQAQHHPYGLADPTVLPHDMRRGGVLRHRSRVRLLTGTVTWKLIQFSHNALNTIVFILRLIWHPSGTKEHEVSPSSWLAVDHCHGEHHRPDCSWSRTASWPGMKNSSLPKSYSNNYNNSLDWFSIEAV